jgi:DNA-binding transcriptional LysR family regulator
MIDPRRLATLQAVARTGSFAGAARALSYTQAAVSQHIAELERTVGLRLLERRPVRLTAAGELALAAADTVRDALAAADTGLRALRDGEAGHLRVAAFASAASRLVAPALAQFAHERADVEITITVTEPDEAYAGLIADRFDLAVTFDYNVHPHDPPAVVTREYLMIDPIVATVPSRHPSAKRRSVRLDHIAREPWIAATLAGLPLAALHQAGEIGFGPTVHYEGGDSATVIALVEAGLGIALLPVLATSKLPKQVVTVPLTGSPIARRIYTARLKDHQPPVAAAFEQLLQARAR